MRVATQSAQGSGLKPCVKLRLLYLTSYLNLIPLLSTAGHSRRPTFPSVKVVDIGQALRTRILMTSVSVPLPGGDLLVMGRYPLHCAAHKPNLRVCPYRRVLAGRLVRSPLRHPIVRVP